MSQSSPYSFLHRFKFRINPTSAPCVFFPHGTCQNGRLCHYRHDPSYITQLELCESFWFSGWCIKSYLDCPRAHVLPSGKVLSIEEYIDHWTELLSSETRYTRHTKHGLAELASSCDVPRLRQSKRRLFTKLDHDDGDEIIAPPPTKRPRQRKNTKNVSEEAWNYIDWEIRRLLREEKLEKDERVEVSVNGKILDPKFVTRRTNEVVGLTEQIHRSHGPNRGQAPEKPPNCIVRKKRIHSSATTYPSDSAIPFDESSDTSPWSEFLQHHDPHSTSDSGLLLSDPESERYESSPVSLTRSRKQTAPSTVQKGWGPTLFDPADQQQDDKFGSVTMTAIPIRTGHTDWHRSPENSPAVPRRSLPIQVRTAAGPAISTVSAVSSSTKLSWDPNNTPFRSPRSYMLTKTSAQSIQRSSMGSKAYQELQSLSFKMGSLGLGS